MLVEALQHSPLYDWHLAARRKMAPFGGWEMPVEYAGAGVLAEHAAVERIGIFDVSHLGKLQVSGPGTSTTSIPDLPMISPRSPPAMRNTPSCATRPGE